MLRRLIATWRAARAGWRGLVYSPVEVRTGDVHVFYPANLTADDPGVDVDRGIPDYSARERGWMQTVTGRRFYPLDPRPEDVDVYDVAHGLAMCCRYAGHALRFYSVAEHCVHVSREVERHLRDASAPIKHDEQTILRWSLLALLHDSSEAYIGDMIRPLKHQPEMAEFRAAELAIEKAVLAALLPDPAYGRDEAWDLIREIDNRIIADEIRILKTDVEMYRDITVEPLGVRIECWGPEWARERFMMRYDGLKRALAQ